MRQSKGMAKAAVAGLLAGLLAFPPGLAVAAPPKAVPAPAPSPRSRPTLTVVLVAEDPADLADVYRLLPIAEQAVRRSGRFELASLSDALDPASGKARKAKADEGRAEMGLGLSAYDELDTVKSLGHFDKAMRAFEQADLSRHFADWSTAWVMKIASLVANGESKAAQLEIDRLLALNPKAQFSPNYFPPEQIAYVERQREVLGRGRGTLEVRTTPSRAPVYLDGAFVGLSPLALRGLTAADHLVTVAPLGEVSQTQRAREGKLEMNLDPAAERRKYIWAVDAMRSDPRGPGRDEAAIELARLARADQVLLGLLRRVGLGGSLEVRLFRLETQDGHTAATARSALPDSDALSAAAKGLFRAVLFADEPRQGGPKRSSDPRGGGLFGRSTGYVLLGAAAALLGGGIYFGLQASSKHASFRETPQTEPASEQLRSSGKALAVVADLFYLGALVGAGAGGYVFFTAPRSGSFVEPTPDPKPETVPPMPAPATNTPDEARRAEQTARENKEGELRRLEEERKANAAKLEELRQRDGKQKRKTGKYSKKALAEERRFQEELRALEDKRQADEARAAELERQVEDARRREEERRRKEEEDDLRHY